MEVILSAFNQTVSTIDGPSAKGDWKTAMRTRILAAREVLLRHWAPGVIETRTAMSPAMVRQFDDLLGIFRQGGFSYDQAHHSMHALGSRAPGFSQELFEPDN